MTCFRASLNLAQEWYITFLTKQWRNAVKRGTVSLIENVRPPGKMCWTLDIVQKVWAPLRKLFASPGVISCLRA